MQPPASTWFALPVRRPVGVMMATAAVFIFGLVSYSKLPLSLMPDLSYPRVTVRTEMVGAAPEEIEALVTEPIEEALEVATQLVAIRSVSRPELSEIVLEFAWGTDMSRLSLEVREKLDQVDLPDEADRPSILRYDPNLDPILELALYGAGDAALYRTAKEEVKRRLEVLEGVAAVKIRGGRAEQVLIRVDQEALTRLRLGVDLINRRLGEENINLAGGSLREGETLYLIRTVNEFRDLDDIRQMILADGPTGEPILLDHVAQVVKAAEDPEVIARVDGEPAVILEVYKEGAANLVEVAGRVKTLVFGAPPVPEWRRRMMPPGADDPPPPLGEELPGGIEMRVVSDQSTFIEAALAEVRNAALLGGLGAALVIFLFLRKVFRTLVVAVSIPVSVVVACGFLHIGGVSLNLMSLGGLALGIGMLVDNAIVVLESISLRRESGQPGRVAAIEGAREVGPAVVASTLTTICVFFPIVFVEGFAGRLFRDQALTVVFSLLASLAVSLTLIPALAARRERKAGRPRFAAMRALLLRPPEWPEARWMAGVRAAPWRVLGFPVAAVLLVLRAALLVIGRVLTLAALLVLFALWLLSRPLVYGFLALTWLPLQGFRLLFALLEKSYPFAVRATVRLRWAVLLLGLALFAWAVERGQGLGSELLPRVERGEFRIELALHTGTPLEETHVRVLEVEALVREVGGADVQTVASLTGAEDDNTTEGGQGPHTGVVTCVLTPGGDVAARERALLARLRPRLAELIETEARISHPALFSLRAPLEVRVFGRNLERLDEVTRDVAEVMEDVPGLADIETSLTPGNPEIQILWDQAKLARLGLDPEQASNVVREKIRGDVPTRFRDPSGEKIDVLVRLDERERRTLEDLENLQLTPAGKKPIPLKEVAAIVEGTGPGEIHHIDRRRCALLWADTGGRRDLSRTVADLDAALAGVFLPRDFHIATAGQGRDMEKSLGSLLQALLLAIFLVYVVMAAMFESLLSPLLILLSIPFALIGTVLALELAGLPISVVVGIGAVVLAGIVVNNSIVLVDCAQRCSAEGLAAEDAIVEAGRRRLRPILMTTLTTLIGLLPMALASGEGAEIRVPLAVTVIGGLISSTLLTLFFLPALLAIFGRFLPKPEAAEESDEPAALAATEER